MKVLFISSWYPNPKNKTHGVFVKRNAEAVALHNKVAVIHVFGHESFKDEIKIESSIENNVYEVFVLYKKKKSDLLSKFNNYKKRYSLGLDFLIKNWGKPDLLQVNVAFPVGIAGMMISEKLNIPYVVSEHWTGYLPEDGSFTGFVKRFLTRKIIRHASSVITVSEHLKKAMMVHRLRGNYTVIPNVVNTSVFNYKEAPEKPRFSFLHVSSLDPAQKNVEGIINVFKKLNKETPLTELYIVGNGENKKALEEKAGQLLNRSIFFSGQKMDSELVVEFQNADCLLMFSNYENLPVVILEALCCGVPVLSSDTGGISEHINENNGYLVKAKDETALLSSMKKVISEYKKFDRKRISEDACARFNYDTIGKEFTGVYNEVLQLKN